MDLDFEGEARGGHNNNNEERKLILGTTFGGARPLPSPPNDSSESNSNSLVRAAQAVAWHGTENLNWPQKWHGKNSHESDKVAIKR